MWATQRPRSRFAPPAQRILPATEQHVNANWPHGSARMSVGMSLLRSDRRTKRSAVSRLHGMKLFFRFRDKNGFPFYFAFRVLSTSLGHLCLGIGLADEVRQEENIFPQIEGRDTVLWKRFQQDHETKNTAWKFSHFSLKKKLSRNITFGSTPFNLASWATAHVAPSLTLLLLTHRTFCSKSNWNFAFFVCKFYFVQLLVKDQRYKNCIPLAGSTG